MLASTLCAIRAAAAMAADQAAAQKKLDDLKAANGPVAEIQAAEKALAAVPANEADAKKAWTAAQAANAVVWTQDADFDGLADVRYFAKAVA